MHRGRLTRPGFYGVCGTPMYMAPEVVLKLSYDAKADVFSFAIVLCEILTGIECVSLVCFPRACIRTLRRRCICSRVAMWEYVCAGVRYVYVRVYVFMCVCAVFLYGLY